MRTAFPIKALALNHSHHSSHEYAAVATVLTVVRAITILSVLFSTIVDSAYGSTITLEFGGTLTSVGGPNGLTVGDTFTGRTTYSLEQTGTNVPLIATGEATQYVFDSYSLTIQGQTVSSTGGDLSIWNDTALGDRFHLTADLTTPAATVTGTINGAPATQMFLALASLNGNPFSATILPTTLNLTDFPDLRRIDVIFQEGRGAVIGEITNLSVVPLPAASWLFLSGLGSLPLCRRRTPQRKTPPVYTC